MKLIVEGKIAAGCDSLFVAASEAVASRLPF